MSEIKPVERFTFSVDHEIAHQDELGIWVKFSDYEALQKEVVHWKANHTDLKERLHVATHRTDLPSDRLPLFDKMKAEIAELRKENALQEKRIAELEELIKNSEVK